MTESNYERLVSDHKDAVYRQMVRVCGDYDDAEDVLVEALLAAYRSKDQIQDTGAFRAWLGTTARRVCFRLRRRESLQPLLESIHDRELVSGDRTAQEELEVQDVKRCVQSALANLPEDFRAVYVMRDIQGLTGEEVAEKLGITLAAMKTRLHRARAKVRDLLDQSFCEPV